MGSFFQSMCEMGCLAWIQGQVSINLNDLFRGWLMMMMIVMVMVMVMTGPYVIGTEAQPNMSSLQSQHNN